MTISTKLTVNAEIKKALDSVVLNSNAWTKEDVIKQVTVNKGFLTPHRKPMNTMPLDQLVQALFVGYELEKPKGLDLLILGTPTARKVDELVKYFTDCGGRDLFSYHDGIRDGICYALAKLDTGVTGINA